MSDDQTIMDRLKRVAKHRWELETDNACLHISGEGKNLSENYHATLFVGDNEYEYEADGKTKHEAWLKLILSIPKDELHVLRELI